MTDKNKEVEAAINFLKLCDFTLCTPKDKWVKKHVGVILSEVKRLKKDNLHFALENSRLEKMLEKAQANVEALQGEVDTLRELREFERNVEAYGSAE